MKGRSFVSVAVFVLLAALITPVIAYAGGWSVVTLDSVPQGITAGTPFTIGFMVRQHGVRPMEGLTPTITFTRAATDGRVTFTAEPEGETGHYVATITLPSNGAWNWKIDAFGPIAEMSPLEVAAAKPAPAAVAPAIAPNTASVVPLTNLSGWIIVAVVSVLALLSLIVAGRARRRTLARS